VGGSAAVTPLGFTTSGSGVFLYFIIELFPVRETMGVPITLYRQNTLLLAEEEAVGRCHFGRKRYEKRNEKSRGGFEKKKKKRDKINAKVAGQIKDEKCA
jgi:hypothetical protein